MIFSQKSLYQNGVFRAAFYETAVIPSTVAVLEIFSYEGSSLKCTLYLRFPRNFLQNERPQFLSRNGARKYDFNSTFWQSSISELEVMLPFLVFPTLILKD